MALRQPPASHPRIRFPAVVTVRLTADTAARLRAVATRDDRTLGFVVRRILDERAWGMRA